MGRGERRVKRLDAECPDVLGEPLRAHERDRAEAADVAVVELPAVREVEGDAEEAALALRDPARVDEQGAGEARLDDEPVAGGEVEDDQLRPAPRSVDTRAADAPGEAARV